jgi:hypothetical protein
VRRGSCVLDEPAADRVRLVGQDRDKVNISIGKLFAQLRLLGVATRLTLGTKIRNREGKKVEACALRLIEPVNNRR